LYLSVYILWPFKIDLRHGKNSGEGDIHPTGRYSGHGKEAGQGEARKSTEGQDEQQGGRLHPLLKRDGD